MSRVLPKLLSKSRWESWLQHPSGSSNFLLSTCQKGRWECTRYACHSTCSIYGSGHYITFHGKHYDFDGHCSYVAVQLRLWTPPGRSLP